MISQFEEIEAENDFTITQVQPDIEVKDISKIELRILNHQYNPKAKKEYWKISVKFDNCAEYTIYRSFSEFEWLLNKLKINDQGYLLPSIGKGALLTYINTKVVRDETELLYRTKNLERCLRVLLNKRQVIKTKWFQYFIDVHFELYKKNHESNSENQSKLNSLMNYFKWNTEIGLQYKNKLKDVEEEVNEIFSHIKLMTQTHSTYLTILKSFSTNLAEEDLLYNKSLLEINNHLGLIQQQISENKEELARERQNGNLWERFKNNIERQLIAYKQKIREQLKEISLRLSNMNKKSETAIRNAFANKFCVNI